MSRDHTQRSADLALLGRRWHGVGRWLAVLAVVIGVAAIAGCASSTTTSTAEQAGNPPTPGACSTKQPTALRSERWSAARRILAPRGAGAIRLCRYSGLNGHPRLTLVASRLLRSRSLVRQLVSEFDRLPSQQGTVSVSCPADDGSEVRALLTYPGGHRVSIDVGLTGCTVVSNGSVSRIAVGNAGAFGPQLIAQLERLTCTRSRPAAGGARALAHGHWSILARSPLGTRSDPVVVWDGRALLELGGTTAGRRQATPHNSGAAYDPTTHHWQRVASAPAKLMFGDAVSAWAGRKLFIFGEPILPHQAATDVAGLYDPATNRWTVSSKAPVRPFAATPTAVWTGSHVILAGITNGKPGLEVVSYDPATNRWIRLEPPISPRHPSLQTAVVKTDEGVLLWSLWGRTKQTGAHSYTGCSGVDVFRLKASGAWSNVTGSWPQHQTVDDPVFTGTRVLLAAGQSWCGTCSHPAPFDAHGYSVNPTTLHRTTIPHGPLDDLGPQIIWTGVAELSLNQTGEITGPHQRVLPGDIAIYNPLTRKWARGPRAPKPLADSAAVWSGNQLDVFAHNGNLLAYRPGDP